MHTMCPTLQGGIHAEINKTGSISLQWEKDNKDTMKQNKTTHPQH